MLPYKCKTCNQRFSVKWRLVHHQKTHEPEKEAKSDESDSSSTPNPKKVILKNTEVLQDFNTHECPVCNISFAGKKQLERHQRAHGDKKYYQCDRCYLAFFWKSNYNRHRKQSCTRRVFQCDKCNRTFNKKSNFLSHKYCHDKDGTSVNDDSFDAQEAGPSTSSQLDSNRDKTSIKKEQKIDAEIAAVVPQIISVKGRIKASKQILNNSDKDATESKSDDKSGDDFSSDPNFGTKKKKPRYKYERKHKCDLCGLGFRFKCDLGRHRRTHDSVKPFPCDQCDLGFNWKSNLVRHQKRMHEGQKTYHCHCCGEGFTKKYHLSRHRNNHKLDNDSLDNDQKVFLSGKTLSENYDCNCGDGSDSNPVVIQLHPTKDEDASTVKNEADSTSKDLTSDNRKLTFKGQEVNIIYLHACNDEIKPDSNEECNPERHREQSETVSTEEVYACNKANKGTQRRRIDSEDTGPDTQARKRIKKEVKQFVCSVCSRVFTRKSCHLQHERSHYKQTLQCEWCHRTFIQKSVFVKHQRLHTGEKPFQCETRPYHCRQKFQSVQHRKNHSSFKPHECEVCKRRFNRKSVLVRHKMIHTGEKPFECEVCHLCFNQKSVLVQHLRIHTGLKPYKCKKCNYSFTHKWNYQRHRQRVQISEKTFSIKCNTCESNFPRKRVLIQQEKIHKKNKFVFHIYNTHIAGKRFKRKDQLKENSIHSDFQEEIKLPRSSQNSDTNHDSDYCEIIEEVEDQKAFLESRAEKVIEDDNEITDFPDHCVPVNIHIRKNIRSQKSSTEVRKSNVVKIHDAKELKEKGITDLDSVKRVNLVEIAENSSEVIHTENSFRTDENNVVEDGKKNQVKNDVGNQQIKAGKNINNVKEITQLRESCNETSRNILNSPVKKTLQEHFDIEESKTVVKISNSSKNIVEDSDKIRKNIIEDNDNIQETRDAVLKICSENIKNVETKKYPKSSLADVKLQTKDRLFKDAVKAELSSADLKTKSKKDNIIHNQVDSIDNKLDSHEGKTMTKNGDGTANSSDLNVYKKNRDKIFFEGENLNKESVTKKNDSKHSSEMDSKLDCFVRRTSNQTPLIFQSNPNAQGMVSVQNKTLNNNLIELKEKDFKSEKTELRRWYSSNDINSIQNNDEKSSYETVNVINTAEKPKSPRNIVDSCSSKEDKIYVSVEISPESEVESNAPAIIRPSNYTRKKELVSWKIDSSTVQNEEFSKTEPKSTENEKCNHKQNIIFIKSTSQKHVKTNEKPCTTDFEEDKSSLLQLKDDVEYPTVTGKNKQIINEIGEIHGGKLHRKACRSKRRLKYNSTIGRKVMNASQGNMHHEEERVRTALSYLKIHDSPDQTTGVRKNTKESNGRISITRQVYVRQTMNIIESIVEIEERDDFTSDSPHSTVNIKQASECHAKTATNIWKQDSNDSLKERNLNGQKSVYELTGEKRTDLISNVSLSEENSSLDGRKFEKTETDKNSVRKSNVDQKPQISFSGETSKADRQFQENILDQNLVQKFSEDPSKKFFDDQLPGIRVDEEVNKNLQFHDNVIKQTRCDYSFESNNKQASNYKESIQEASMHRKRVFIAIKENHSNEGQTALHKENCYGFIKSNDNGTLRVEDASVFERNDSVLEEIPTLKKHIFEIPKKDLSGKNCEFSEKMPEISSKETEGRVNRLLEMDNNQKPIQCREINHTQNSCKERNFDESSTKCGDDSDVIDSKVQEDTQFNPSDQKPPKKSNDPNSIQEIADNQVSSSGINSDCDFPQISQADQSSTEKTDNLLESYVRSEKRETIQLEKNSYDSFGFIDFNSLSSPTRYNDFCTKSEIPSFSGFKSTAQSPESNKAQNSGFPGKSQRNNRLDFMKDTRTDLELVPLQNERSNSAFTEYNEGILSYQDQSGNFTTPNKNRHYQRTELFELEKTSSNLEFPCEIQSYLKPITCQEYIPFENTYQHSASAIPFSENVQSIPSYAEAFSRPRLALNNTNVIYTSMYPGYVAVDSQRSVTEKEVSYTAISSTSNENSSYDHYQYEDYMQNFYPNESRSTYPDEEVQSSSNAFRLQQRSSVEDNFGENDTPKQTETTMYDPDMSNNYQILTPQRYDEPVSANYERTYFFPEHCEEPFNYSRRQEKVRTYAVHHEEVHTIQDLIRFEKSYIHPVPPTEMPSTEVPLYYKESNSCQSSFGADTAFPSNYFRINVSNDRDQVSLNTLGNHDPVSLNVPQTENESDLTLQLSQDQTEKNSEDPWKAIHQVPQDLSLMKTPTSLPTDVQISKDAPNLKVQMSPIAPKSNEHTLKSYSAFNIRPPQGLFQRNVSPASNFSWKNLQGTPRFAVHTPDESMRLIKPSPQYPVNHPIRFVPSTGLKHLSSPGSSYQSKSRCFQDQDWRSRANLDLDRNRRIHFESTKMAATHIEQRKGIFVERVFRCDRCDHSFVRKEDLIRHRFTAHEKFRIVKPASYALIN